MDPEKLRAIIHAAGSGREHGYREILTSYGPRLYGYFYRATGSRHDAEDLVGEVMLRLVRRLGDYDEQGRFEPWLFSIAANLVRDRIRRATTRPASASLDAESSDGASLVDSVRGPRWPVEAGLDRADLSEALNAALDKLDAPARGMVLLRYFGQMSFKEIAEVFQCPLGTVLAKVHRALKALRVTLERDYGADT
ncbi:MAG TPA: sigma-70 family RNA polymerase sigma factor [Phycisphaerae bacterium]|nr:sigma-70 family RNA polymerase sigma factor [Phycisphaerae bacterium]